MISLLARRLLKDETPSETALRKVYGVLCSGAGILLNGLLFAGKFLVGRLSGSIAVTADAFNNLSDAGSSLVTLLGFQLAGQKADPHHPFGHGRLEYLSGLLVALLILLMGVELMKSSVEQILHPVPVELSALLVGVLCVSIAAKIFMAFYYRRIGRSLRSAAMEAAGTDSLCDAIATAAVLGASVFQHMTTRQIDGWAGVLVALFIFYSGWKAAKSTLDPLLGVPPTPEFVEQIRSMVLAHPKIQGIHDLIVHDYGPGRVMISLHAEVSASENVVVLHDAIDHVERELQEKLGCEAVIHMDPLVTDDAITTQTRDKVQTLVKCIDETISIHDFRMVAGPTHTNLIFDAVVPFHFRLTDREVQEHIAAAVRVLDEGYQAVVRVERSYT